MLRTCRAILLLIAATLCSEAVRAVSPGASHARLVLRPTLRGGHIGSSCAPNHPFSSSESNQTPGQLRKPGEGGADGDTAYPPLEVAEGEPRTHSLLLRLARRAMGAVTPPWVANCVPFLREKDDAGRGDLEVKVRCILPSLKPGRIK